MNAKERKWVPFFLLTASLSLLIGFWGTVRLDKRPGIRAILEKSDGHLCISQLTPGGKAEKSGLKSRDLILEVNKNPVQSNSDLNFHLDQKRIGESVNLILQRNGAKIDLTVPLERKNSLSFLLVNFLAGLFLWVMGVFVFLKKPNSQVARIF